MAEKLVIFDCDGVLVDSEFVASRIFTEALAEYGYSISTEESIRRFTGVDEHTAREIILKESAIDIPTNYWSAQQPNLLKAYETEMGPLLQPFLCELDSLKIPRCVASNSSRSHVLHCLETSNQLGYFTAQSIFSSQQVKKPKPAPDLFLFAAKEMGFKPEDCIVVEDSPAGTEAAIAAGMEVVVFLGGRHTRYEWYHSLVATYNRPMAASWKELWEIVLPGTEKRS